MATEKDAVMRARLLERRDRLETVRSRTGEVEDLRRLLAEVDAALGRIDGGTFGLCQTCKDPIEDDLLVADPLVCYCLDHLTPEQQRDLERDLALAARVQGELLPRGHREIDGWEVRYHYEPAGPVSGDYCDLLADSENAGDFVFLLGDVSGKGVAASMLMSQLHALFRGLMPAPPTLDRLMERANRLFCESTMEAHYATLVCGRAGRSGEVEVCNAGHAPPLLVHQGEVTTLQATSLPIGLFCSGRYPVRRLSLERGDSLVLYTDGLSEARSGEGGEYGVSRLSALIGEQHALAPAELVRAIVADLASHLAGTPRTDDLTVMVVRRTG